MSDGTGSRARQADLPSPGGRSGAFPGEFRVRSRNSSAIVIACIVAVMLLVLAGLLAAGPGRFFDGRAVWAAVATHVGGLALGAWFLRNTRRAADEGAGAAERFARMVEITALLGSVYALAHLHISGSHSSPLFGILLIPLGLAMWTLEPARAIRLSGLMMLGYAALGVASLAGWVGYAPVYLPDVAITEAQSDARHVAVTSVTLVLVYANVLFYAWLYRMLLEREALELAGLVVDRTVRLRVARNELKDLDVEQAATHRATLETQRELAEQRRELERYAGRGAAGQVAAAIAHEINQPLSVIELRSSIAERSLRREGGRERAKAALAEVGAATARAREIINAMRRLDRPSQPGAPVDLGSLATETGPILGPSAARAGVEVAISVPDTPIRVVGDRGQLQQVLVNLMQNAVQALASQEGRRVVQASVTERDGAAVLTVADNGPGIPDGIDIFAPFNSGRVGGLGLGLALCRSIIHRHGGELSAADSEQGGAAFVVELPLAEPPEAKDER